MSTVKTHMSYKSSSVYLVRLPEKRGCPMGGVCCRTSYLEPGGWGFFIKKMETKKHAVFLVDQNGKKPTCVPIPIKKCTKKLVI